MKSVTAELKSRGPHEKHAVATWNVGNHLSICLKTQGNRENPVVQLHLKGSLVMKSDINMVVFSKESISF